MKIKLIDFGLKKDHFPFRPHAKDAGADAFMPYDHTLNPGEIIRIPLGFGLIISDGFAGYVFPRSSMAAQRPGMRTSANRFRISRRNPCHYQQRRNRTTNTAQR